MRKVKPHFRPFLTRPIRWSFILTALIVCAMMFMTMGLSRYKEPLNAVMLVFLAVNMSRFAPRTAREP
jgi:drug/metabolite transporter (DMT)-like permease